MSTPIRGCAWPRRSPAIAAPSAPIRCRALTTISTRPICIVLVGSNAAWCHPVLFQRMLKNKQERGAQHRRDRSAPHRRPARTPTCSSASSPAWTRRCSPACWCISPTTARSTATISARHTERLRRGAGARRAAIAGSAAATAFATGLAAHDVAAFFDLFRTTQRVVTAFRKASTSRRRAPTRSTPSSTAISRRAASASRARGRCR